MRHSPPQVVLLVLFVLALFTSRAAAQSFDDLRVGHWVEVKGKLAEGRRFEAEALEVLAPDDQNVLIGTVDRVDVDGGRLFLLAQEVHVSDKTDWGEGLSLAKLEGKRVKAQGRYRGPTKFSARSIAARGSGRDRIAGRIDALERRPADAATGAPAALELSIAGYQVVLSITGKLENEDSFAALALAPEIEFETASGETFADDEDVIQGNLRLADTLFLGGIVEYKGEREDGFDLDEGTSQDSTKQRLSMRLQLTWRPSDRFRVLASPRFEFEDRRRIGGEDTSTGKPHWNELYAEVVDVLGTGFDVTVGRQRFDDGREWVYKKNLDGVRLVRAWEAARLELSWTTLVDDGSDRDKHTSNLIGYLSNGSEKRHLALYVVDRRDDRSPRDYPIHFGARAVGEFLPDVRSWAEFSLLRGYTDDTNLRGYGFDFGATWKPDPWRFTFGYAFGSGDDDATTNTREAFHQTGLQRNNDKVGGATSVRYYGELLDPELSNLTVLTFGVGYELARKTSVEVLWHRYAQVVADASLADTNLERSPDGIARGLGDEVDVVFGTKALSGWEFEVVFGRFDPGAAFPGGDPAWLAAFQTRLQF
ncbi:MAG: alginate export family protein [Planctomycetes bacterium]|nr:alginate export family protein [Planctomycetota bacterium]